jgi:DNA-binding transcriptional LysR family regulator
MDPRKLLYLATIIEWGSLAKAAKQLAVSQPALSKSMDRLEADLGVKLLERGATGVTPTKSGELVYAHARSMREEMALAQRCSGRDPVRSNVLTLATLPSLASSVIALAVARWRASHPGGLLRVVEKVQIELLVGLQRGDFDFVVGQTEFFDILSDGLKQRVLFRDRLSVFARAEHALFQKDPLDWADTATYPWICPMVGWSQRNALEKLMDAQGIRLPVNLVECGSINFTKALVTSSDHLALLPIHSVAADVSAGFMKALPLDVSSLKRDIAVVFQEKAPLNTESYELIRHIEEVGQALWRG